MHYGTPFNPVLIVLIVLMLTNTSARPIRGDPKSGVSEAWLTLKECPQWRGLLLFLVVDYD